VTSLLTTIYTGFLFAQGLARDLWQGPQSTIDLVAQAIAEGSAVLLLASLVPGLGVSGRIVSALAMMLIAAMAVHIALIVFEQLVAPSPTRHHQLAVAAVRRGAFARLFWAGAIAAAFASIAVAIASTRVPAALGLAALLALAGSFAWEYIWVEAGQSVPLS
jgi:Ni/Fe-hydrogenase subunit HybB-like protein